MIEKLDLPEEKRITMTTMREQVLMIDKLNELIEAHEKLATLHDDLVNIVRELDNRVNNLV